MAERQPTIEQNSHFTAKTKQGQDVEFTAILKFYVSPSGEVQISAPSSTSSTSTTHLESTSESSQIGSVSKEKGDVGKTKASRYAGADQSPTGQEQHTTAPISEEKKVGEAEVKVEDKKIHKSDQVEEEGSEKEVRGRTPVKRRDESIDKAFPRGPSDCPITQFIPDPCRAFEDIQKSVKNLFSSFFSRECPPPQNTDNTNKLVSPQSKGQAEQVLDNSKEDNTDSEIIQNEQKYDV